MVGGEEDAPPKKNLKRTTNFTLAFRTPPCEECVSLIRIGGVYKMAVREDLGEGGSPTTGEHVHETCWI